MADAPRASVSSLLSMVASRHGPEELPFRKSALIGHEKSVGSGCFVFGVPSTPSAALVATSNNGNRPTTVSSVCTGCDDGSIRVWDVETDKTIKMFSTVDHNNRHEDKITVVKMLLGNVWSSSLDGTIREWDFVGERCITKLEHDASVTDFVFWDANSSNSSSIKIISSCSDKSIYVWDDVQRNSNNNPNDKTSTAAIPSSRIRVSCFVHELLPWGKANLLYVGGGLARCIRLLDGELISEFGPTDSFSRVTAVGVCNPGNVVVTGESGGVLRSWDVEVHVPRQQLRPHASEITKIACLDETNFVATASEEGSVCISDISTGQLLLRFSGHVKPARFVSVMFTSRMSQICVLSGSDDCSAQVWYVDLDRLFLEAAAGQVTSLAALCACGSTRIRRVGGNGKSLLDYFAFTNGEQAEKILKASQPLEDVSSWDTVACMVWATMAGNAGLSWAKMIGDSQYRGVDIMKAGKNDFMRIGLSDEEVKLMLGRTKMLVDGNPLLRESRDSSFISGSMRSVEKDKIQVIHGGAVLVVDDVKLNRLCLLPTLTGLGYEVDQAENGEQALNMAKRRRYRIIFMDLQMPVMDGIDATAAIKADERNANIPIFGMSANLSETDEAKCINAGMLQVLRRPCVPSVIKIACVRALRLEFDQLAAPPVELPLTLHSEPTPDDSWMIPRVPSLLIKSNVIPRNVADTAQYKRTTATNAAAVSGLNGGMGNGNITSIVSSNSNTYSNQAIPPAVDWKMRTDEKLLLPSSQMASVNSKEQLIPIVGGRKHRKTSKPCSIL